MAARKRRMLQVFRQDPLKGRVRLTERELQDFEEMKKSGRRAPGFRSTATRTLERNLSSYEDEATKAKSSPDALGMTKTGVWEGKIVRDIALAADIGARSPRIKAKQESWGKTLKGTSEEMLILPVSELRKHPIIAGLLEMDMHPARPVPNEIRRKLAEKRWLKRDLTSSLRNYETALRKFKEEPTVGRLTGLVYAREKLNQRLFQLGQA